MSPRPILRLAPWLLAALLLPAATQAAEFPPLRVQATNLHGPSGVGFTVHWFTELPCEGRVIFGTNPEQITSTAYDVRDDTGGPIRSVLRRVHYVYVFVPSSEYDMTLPYYFKVVTSSAGGADSKAWGSPEAVPTNLYPFKVTKLADPGIPPTDNPAGMAKGNIFKDASLTGGSALAYHEGDTATPKLSSWKLENIKRVDCDSADLTLYWGLQESGGTVTLTVYKDSSLLDDLASGTRANTAGDIVFAAGAGASDFRGQVHLDAPLTALYFDRDAGNRLLHNEVVAVFVARYGDPGGDTGSSLPASQLVTSSNNSWRVGSLSFAKDGGGYFSFEGAGDINPGGDWLDMYFDGGYFSGGMLGAGNHEDANPSTFGADTLCFSVSPPSTDVTLLNKLPPRPWITSVSPASGVNSITTYVTITGHNLMHVTSATINAMPLRFVVPISDNTLRAMVPAGIAAGAYGVVLTSAGGNSTETINFTVQAAQSPVNYVSIKDVTSGISSVSTITISSVTVSGSNPLLLVEVGTYDKPTITASFNSVSMVSLGSRSPVLAGPKVEMFALTTPSLSIGTHDVVINLTASTRVAAAAMLFNGVDQTSPTRSFTGATGVDIGGGVYDATAYVSSSSSEIVVDAISARASVAITNSGQTERWNRTLGGGSTKPGESSTTMSWLADGAIVLVSVSIRPAGAGSQSVPQPLVQVGASASTGPTNANSFTISGLTVGSESDRLLLVGISSNAGARGFENVTRGGTPFQLVGYNIDVISSSRVDIYALVAPASGSGNIVINYDTSPPTLDTVDAICGAVYLYNINQQYPVSRIFDATGNATSVSVPVDSNVTSFVFDVMADTTATNPLPGAGQTSKWTSGSGAIRGGASTKAGDVSTTMQWTFSGGTGPVIGAVSINPLNNAWIAAVPMTQARAAHQLVPLSDNQVLAVGGHDGTNPLALVERYTTGVGWETRAPLTTGARYGHAAVRLSDGRIFVCGGCDASGNSLNTAEIYTPGTNIWASAGTMSVARSGHTATLLTSPADAVIVAGGENVVDGQITVTAHATYDVYTPGSGWTALGNALAAKRAYHAAVATSTTQVLLAGGLSTDGSGNVILLDSCEVTTTGSSSAEPYTLGTARMCAQAVWLPGPARALLLGGWGGTYPYQALNSVEKIDPTGNTIDSAAPCMKTARVDFRAALVSTNGILVAGGWNIASDGTSAIQGVPTSQLYTYGSGWADEQTTSTNSWEFGLAKLQNSSPEAFVRCGGWVAGTAANKPLATYYGDVNAPGFPAALKRVPRFKSSDDSARLAAASTIVASGSTEILSAPGDASTGPAAPDGDGGTGFCFASVAGGVGGLAAASALLALLFAAARKW